MAEKICNKCGSRLHSSVNYCPYCKSSSFRSLNEIQLHDDSLKYKLFYWKQGSYYVLSKTKVATLVTFAFFAGSFLGKHKLCPKISPKKTIEGAIGGILGCVIASLILTLGIGGAEMSFSGITIGGIGLAALVGVILNLIIPKGKAK